MYNPLLIITILITLSLEKSLQSLPCDITGCIRNVTLADTIITYSFISIFGIIIFIATGCIIYEYCKTRCNRTPEYNLSI